MASRKEQLNAYTFARKRVVAAFLQPSPSGSDEGAPRPMRALVPGIVVGAVLLAGFGAWGLISPSVPHGWDEPGKHVIVADESTTRYVVLNDADTHKPVLHPVLNMASARLLLDPGAYDVIKVKESVLDHSGLKHGATIGIPYAPDRLPSATDAGKPKAWAVCDRPGGGSSHAAQQAVFVLGGDEAAAMNGPSALNGSQVLYVQNQDGIQYLVDPRGTKYELGGPDPQSRKPEDMGLLLRTLFGEDPQPQTVSETWLASLHKGTPIWFPSVDDRGSTKKVIGVPGGSTTVGTVLRAVSGKGYEYYVVTKDGVAPITQFASLLLLQANHQTAPVQTSIPVTLLQPFLPDDWPQSDPSQVNTSTGDSPRDVACSVLQNRTDGTPGLKTTLWAGKDYPEQIVEGASSAYVTPGSGLLYQEVSGTDTSGGTLFLVTDTGLRYAVSRNNDSAAANKASDSKQEVNQASVRLGYQDVKPMSIPSVWSELLPKGPALDTASAAQPQGS
ncbi:type VII secretion protein EccB [Actinacidiphila bryophytorum]|uniref:Type VII secretion protein EccB n=1 Tax=Actinacidiphila bryophytorum TaxID=1436133 RepID=A0A9W4GY16_9ACTN|nr:type VII secretion protein EccB [Actinacidiphila bryophytorum]MBM9435623.1 type VII secretion protein EccB [Actinacidiphila bryophytorum]MBN6543309.1 type VII secretion protein EccB [Actinacidiphila bryophytorum]CAG7610117.1 Type VII secretion protein EccB [Actinacidiphila bryophytorum]